MTWGAILLLLGSAYAAGAVNSVAGGGSLLTFPSLLAAGLSPLAANATSKSPKKSGEKSDPDAGSLTLDG